MLKILRFGNDSAEAVSGEGTCPKCQNLVQVSNCSINDLFNCPECGARIRFVSSIPKAKGVLETVIAIFETAE